MPQVPGTKVWLRKNELNTICRAIEATPPAGRLMIAYDYALNNVRRAKQALSNTKRVKTFVIWYWFNLGWESAREFGWREPLDTSKFTDAMNLEEVG